VLTHVFSPRRFDFFIALSLLKNGVNVKPTNKQRGTKRPGPVPLTPSKDNLRRVELGVSAGVSVAALARLFDLPVTTFRRAYKEQIETGQTRVILDALAALDKAARYGSAAAAKALLATIEKASTKPAEAEPDKWSGLADRIHAQMANSVDSQEWEN
jgi:hypothetical protein